MAMDVSKNGVVKAIYGLVTVLAVLAVMRDHPPAAWQAAVTALLTTLSVALIEMYAETIGATLHRQRRLTRAEVSGTWHHVAPVLVGAQAPTVVLVLSAIGFFPVEQAIDIAQVVLFLFLFVYGVRVGGLLHEQWFRQLLSGLSVVAIAVVIVATKALPLLHP